jgi:C-terminal processing protease CtpA/Prc
MCDMTPADYLQHALQIIEKEAYYQPSPAVWRPLKARLFREVAMLQTIPDVYPLIQYALKSLGDSHSHLYVPGREKRKQKTSPGKKPLFPEGKHLNGWGYITLPRSVGNNDYYQTYADTGQQIVRAMRDVPGWIVDLRTNRGGNSWPMKAAIGPLMGEGTLGYHIGRTGRRIAWGYANGASVWDGDPVYAVDNPVPVIADAVPVAVLVSGQTGSAGESTLIAFLGRPNLRTFGTLTRGIPTANSTIALPDVPGADEAYLTLTTQVTADRIGRIYDTHIHPDVICPDALTMAQRWLTSVV